MQVAQKLYEGVQLSDGKATGLITYLRTDGLHVSINFAVFLFPGMPNQLMFAFCSASN
jgi:hypothetical protein